MAHGTWKTTSGGGDALLPLAVLVGAVILIGSGALTAAVAAVTDLLMIAFIIGAVIVAAVLAAGVLWWRHLRKSGRRPGEMPPHMREHLAAVHARREAERLASTRPQIAAPAQNHVHLHYHAAPGAHAQPDWQAAALRALPEREQQR